MAMSPWFSVLLVGLALLVGVFALRRKGRQANQIAPDSTTQVAALRALQEPAAAASPAPAPAPVPYQPETIPAAHLSVRAETLRTLREVAFGTPMPVAPSLASDDLYLAVGAVLKNIVDKPNYAPRRPMQLPKLMRAINDETASRREFSQIIAGDPALAGNLLRLANSPFYRHGPQAVESLDRQAVRHARHGRPALDDCGGAAAAGVPNQRRQATRNSVM